MVNYQNSKIYRLVCSETNKQYIGSTTRSLSQRKSGHKEKKNDCSSKGFINPEIFLIKNCPCDSIEQLHSIERSYIESMECVNRQIPGRTKKEYYEKNKEDMKEKKKEYLKINKDKIKEKKKEYHEKNKDKIKEKKKEYREINKDKIKEKMKEYAIKNKEQLLKYNKNYYQENKDKIQKYRKEYLEINKDKIKEKKKEHYQANKEKIKEKEKEKFICDCGSELRKCDKARHFKTIKHQNFIKD